MAMCRSRPALMSFRNDVQDHTTHYEAVGTLGNLVHSSPDIKRRVLAEGVLQPVINLLQCTCRESLREAALLVGQFAQCETRNPAQRRSSNKEVCFAVMLFAYLTCRKAPPQVFAVAHRHASMYVARVNQVRAQSLLSSIGQSKLKIYLSCACHHCTIQQLRKAIPRTRALTRLSHNLLRGVGRGQRPEPANLTRPGACESCPGTVLR
jgi:hypothetical protein